MISSRENNIAKILKLLEDANVTYIATPSGRDIKFGTKGIKINHNGVSHWTIRVPGAAKDGIRLLFNAELTIADGLFIIGDTLAIKYD